MTHFKNLFRTRGLAGLVGLIAWGTAIGIIRFQLPATGPHFIDYVLQFLVGMFAFTCGMVMTNLILMLRENRRQRRTQS